MNDSILAAIDAEITKLQQVRSLIADTQAIANHSVGRPKGSKSAAKKSAKKRVLSPEARARIAAAQKKRWAAAKKS